MHAIDNGVGSLLNSVQVVFDRFHVISQINKALEAVRQEEQRDNGALKKSQFLWLNKPKNLTARQEAQLRALKRLDLKTARAYQIKLALARFWEMVDPAEVVAYLCQQSCNINPLRSLKNYPQPERGSKVSAGVQ